MNLIRKFSKNPFSGDGSLKVSILFVSGNSLLLLFLAFYELDPPGGPLRTMLEGTPLYLLSFPALTVFSGACYLFQKKQADRMRKKLGDQEETLEKTVTLLEEVTGFYQSSSVISTHKDESLLLDLIARESLKCLRAHRAILFLLEEGSGHPKVGSIFASETPYESPNLDLEGECAHRTLKQKKPLLLREPRDFSELGPNRGKNRNVVSLLSVPLIRLGETLGVISVSLMDGDRKFSEKDQECLSLFSHHAAAAIQKTAEGGHIDLHRDLDRELERIADHLRGFSQEEQGKILAQIRELLPNEGDGKRGGSPKEPFAGSRSRPAQRTEKWEEEKIMYVTPGDGSFEFTEEFGDGGLFIRTPNPLELGEHFLLRLHKGNGDEPIEVNCKVIWTNQYGKENKHLSRGMGVKFMDLRREDRKRLQDYLKTSSPVSEASS